MGKIWFTSDQHFGHANIIKYCNRPFVDVESMNAGLIANFNSVVNPEDLTYHLGDFSLSLNLMEEILPKLNGCHRLIMGNHDKCWPGKFQILKKIFGCWIQICKFFWKN